jgi:hypothetical protein
MRKEPATRLLQLARLTASLTSPHSLLPLLGSMKRALRNLGALKDRGPGARRSRRRPIAAAE